MRVIAFFILFIVIFLGNAYGESYRVKKGDSLYKISKRLGVSVEVLKEINNLEGDKLKPGMKLHIPDKGKEKDHRPERTKRAEVSGHGTTTELHKTVEGVTSERPEFHIVKKGETLSSIARKYGLSISELRDINDLASSKGLRVGQKILLKRTVPRIYTVKRGDNIWRIAKRFNLDVEELIELNELDSEELRPGQRLYLSRDDEKEMKKYEALIAELKDVEIPESDSKPVLSSLGIRERLVLFAKKMLNIPYRFGGSSFMGIDCSGYVQKVFGLLNIPLPRSAREQFTVGEPVSKEELSIGDLVFFRTYASFPSHVGIYLGNNLFIHASSKSRKVTIDSLDAPYYLKRFIGAKRVISENIDQQGPMANNQ